MVARGDLVKSFTKVKILLYGPADLQVGDSQGCAHESEIVPPWRIWDMGGDPRTPGVILRIVVHYLAVDAEA